MEAQIGLIQLAAYNGRSADGGYGMMDKYLHMMHENPQSYLHCITSSTETIFAKNKNNAVG
jgi:hypothetical protein